jgi:glutathione S-transferase
MKFINSLGPNPRMVRMFMLEKGIKLPAEEVDILAGENRQAPYLKRNPGGQTPALELDDGTVIAETAAICEYLEELHPAPALIGRNPADRARSRMWQRRVEFNISENLLNGFRYGEGYDLFKDRIRCIPAAAKDVKAIAQERLAWLNDLMSERSFICGDELRFVDLSLYCCLDFAKDVGQPLNPDLKKIGAWFARIDARPTARASLHPASEQVKMRA